MDDYIPKDAIINSPHKYYAPADGVAKNDGYNPGDWAIQIDKVMEIPAADVAPIIHARWIEEDGVQTCSNCGEEHEWIDYRAPYCDACGAKMDKEEDNG